MASSQEASRPLAIFGEVFVKLGFGLNVVAMAGGACVRSVLVAMETTDDY